MMLSPKGEKLSKRHAAVSVLEYKQKGYTPEAVLNYLVRFGWSSGDREIFSRDELIEAFNWDSVGKSDGKFDEKKFADVAFEHLKQERLTNDERYLKLVEPYLEEAGLAEPDEDRLRAALPLIRERARDLKDAAFHLDFYFRDPPEMDPKAKAKFLTAEAAPHLQAMHERIGALPSFDAESIEKAIADYVSKRDLKMKVVAQPLRVALTGRTMSPGLFEVMQVLGKERSLARILSAAKASGKGE
jgi:glutamyl-tRNA synthetase